MARKSERLARFTASTVDEPGFVGVDVHKRTYSVALFCVADGQVESWNCPADEAGLVEQPDGARPLEHHHRKFGELQHQPDDGDNCPNDECQAEMAEAGRIKSTRRTRRRSAVQGRNQDNQTRRLIAPSPTFGHSSEPAE